MERITGRPCHSIPQQAWFTFRRRPTAHARLLSSPTSLTRRASEIPEFFAPVWDRRFPLPRRSGRCRKKDNTSRSWHGIPSVKESGGALQAEALLEVER